MGSVERDRAGVRRAPTGSLRGRVRRRVRAYEGRHEACPYGGGSVDWGFAWERLGRRGVP